MFARGRSNYYNIRNMKNVFEIRSDCAVIYLGRENGPSLETVIDLADLPRAAEIEGAWYALWQENVKSFYAATARPTIRLHRWLTRAPLGAVVDHNNHNTLDNRRSTNLTIATHAHNTSHFRRKRPGRGYYRSSGASTWYVKTGRAIDGAIKQTYWGSFATEELAKQRAEEVYASAEYAATAHWTMPGGGVGDMPPGGGPGAASPGGPGGGPTTPR